MAASPSGIRAAGHKQKYREIDFKRDKAGVPGVVAAIEYDPNRSANIALIHYVDGEKRYILSPKGLEVGRRSLPGRLPRSSRATLCPSRHTGRHYRA